MCTRCVFWLIPLIGFISAARAEEPDPELVHAVSTLREAKIDTSGSALIRFFKERTLTADDRSRLSDAVRRLGDDDFETREKASDELLRAGRKALPFLRPAQNDMDPERARRVALCLLEIESGAELTRIVAVARVLTERRPDGASSALLAYLPGAEDEEVEEALMRALLAVGMKDGRADESLIKALMDKEPLRRAAAAYVLGRADPGHRASVRRLFADPEARVRFEAGIALVRAGDKEAVPVLVRLLGEGPMPLGWRVQEILSRIAGDKGPALTLADEEPVKRAKVADAWRAWWKAAAAETDLGKINLDEALRGINVICEEGVGGVGRVWACRADGKPIWEIKNVMAWDVQLLPNGHVLIGEHNAHQVTERNLQGDIVWKKTVDNQISTCRRLPNGNTFIGTFNEILEVDPKGTTVYSYKDPAAGLIARAHRLRNGHLLFACGGDRIVELDAQFKEIRRLKVVANGDSWISVEPLPGDRFLVAPYGASKVTELDASGKVRLEFNSPQPMSAVRLPNGNTLVSCDREHAIVEYDRAGKEVWRLKLASSVRCVRRF